MSETVDSHTLKNAASALWEAGVLPMSGDQADQLAEALAARGLLPAAVLADAAIKKVSRKLDNVAAIVQTIDSATASLRSELDLIRDAVAALRKAGES